MSFSQIVTYLLYGLSGFFFGIFASRYSVLSCLHIRSKYQEEGISCLFSCLPHLLFLSCSFFLFPSWFATRTTTGAFFYYACLLFFYSKGMRSK
ncbi:hypothetical protein [Phascolarctobacterium sp.]|uniref:hypothetical protein n=1 Tax=Phascolarctobacterium sp. TaxID=2049039 RepID=UPI00386EFB72